MSKKTRNSLPGSVSTTGKRSWYRDSALWLGLAAVSSFSFTFPAIHEAGLVFGSQIVGGGRILIAAFVAGMLLLIKRDAPPRRETWGRLCLVAFGAIIGFPFFSTLALEKTSVAHGAILTGMLPAATASYWMVRTRVRPSLRFRVSAVVGMFTALSFALIQGAGHLQIEDGWMVLAVITGAVGYAEGGNLARELGAWKVISWSLLIAAPCLVLPVGWNLAQQRWQSGQTLAWLSLLYISIVSLFCGLIAWYTALGRGGITRISQLQLLQPVLTIGWAALLLDEHLTLLTGIAAAIVVLCVCVAVREQRQVREPETADAAEQPASGAADTRQEESASAGHTRSSWL